MSMPEFTAEHSLGKAVGSYGYWGRHNVPVMRGWNVMGQPEMQPAEVKEQSEDQPVEVPREQPSDVIATPAPIPSPGDSLAASVTPQHCGLPGCSIPGPHDHNDAEKPATSYVYTWGGVDPRFPRLSVEKEFAQAVGRAETVNLTDRQTLREVLSQRENRYLAWQLCWVLTIEDLDTYILQPRDPTELDMLVEALRPTRRPTDVNIVIGVRGPIAPPEMCNGLMVPIVVFDQIYSADIESLIKSMPKPEKITEKQFESAAEDLLMRIMQMADNAGATDEHRALNYLVLRYPAIYATTAEMFGRNFSLAAVDVRLSPLSGTHNIVEAIFSYTHRETDVTEKFFVRVDVTGEWPFLVTKLSPYFDR